MSRARLTNRLATIRRQQGLSQARAAQLVGCRERQKIARYERGERLPSLATAAAFAVAYRVPVEELFPAVFKKARAATERNRTMITRSQRSPYVSPPDTTTVLALHPGTRNVGVAVFEALPSR